jgi:hypothetical protein
LHTFRKTRGQSVRQAGKQFFTVEKQDGIPSEKQEDSLSDKQMNSFSEKHDGH